MQLLQDLVHGLLFVLEFLELGEFGTGSCRSSVQPSVWARGRVEEWPVLRWADSLGAPGPANLPGEGKTLRLATVVWHCFSLWDTDNESAITTEL